MDTQQVTITEQVRVVNNGEHHVTWNWNNRTHVIPAHGEKIGVPFECIKVYCGDPRAGAAVQRIRDQYDQDQVIPDRQAEVRRLYQFYQESSVSAIGPDGRRGSGFTFREFIPGDRSWFDPNKGISDLAPKVEVYALTGDRIFTVLDDPFGDNVIAADSPTIAQRQQMDSLLMQQAHTIAEQDRMIKALMQRLDMNPNDLGPDLPLGNEPLASPPVKQDAVPETPTQATVQEKPRMVFNPRLKRVVPAPNPVADPTTVESLPDDND